MAPLTPVEMIIADQLVPQHFGTICDSPTTAWNRRQSIHEKLAQGFVAAQATLQVSALSTARPTPSMIFYAAMAFHARNNQMVPNRDESFKMLTDHIEDKAKSTTNHDLATSVSQPCKNHHIFQSSRLRRPSKTLFEHWTNVSYGQNGQQEEMASNVSNPITNDGFIQWSPSGFVPYPIDSKMILICFEVCS